MSDQGIVTFTDLYLLIVHSPHLEPLGINASGFRAGRRTDVEKAATCGRHAVHPGVPKPSPPRGS